MSEEPEPILGFASSEHNLVAAAVGLDGLPAKLAIRPEAMRLSPDELSAEILATLQSAHREATKLLVRRMDDMQIDPHTPNIRQAREAATQAQAEAARALEQVRIGFDGVRRTLGSLDN